MLLYAALQPAPSRRKSIANPHRDRRAVASRELWEALAARWQILRRHGRDLGGSLILNLLVSRGDDQVVVVRVRWPSVSRARVQDIQAVRDRLDAAGVPCPALAAARDGAGRVRLPGGSRWDGSSRTTGG